MKIRVFLLGTILTISLLIGFLSLTEGHFWGGDFSAYIMQARSIVDGSIAGFLESNTFTYENSSGHVGPIAYPWGFPVLLSPIYYLSGFNIIALKSVGLVSFILFLVCIYFLFKERLSVAGNFLLLSFFAFHPVLLSYQDKIQSDIPFLFFSTLSMLLIDRIFLSKQRLISNVVDNALLGIICFFAFFIRTNGILLLPVIFFCQIVQFVTTKRIEKTNLKEIFYTYSIPYVIFFVLSFLSFYLFPKGTSNFSIFSIYTTPDLVVYIKNFIEQPRLFFRGLPLHEAIVYGFTLVFFIIGIIVTLKNAYHFCVYSFLTLFIHVVVRANPNLRYFFPLLPFYIYFVFKGITWSNFGLTDQFKKTGQVLTSVFFFIVLVSLFRSSINAAYANISNDRKIAGPFTPVSKDMFSFISNQTDSNDVIVFFKPRVLTMMTNRRSIMINHPSQLHRGDYLVAHKYIENSKWQVSGNVLENQLSVKKINVVYQNADFIVFKIKNKGKVAN